jgi:NAD-specific glutamate dehydrogenase
MSHRRLTTQIAASGRTGTQGVADWVESRSAEVARTRDAIDGIVASGLTLAKLMVTGSLLGDLVKE